MISNILRFHNVYPTHAIIQRFNITFLHIFNVIYYIWCLRHLYVWRISEYASYNVLTLRFYNVYSTCGIIHCFNITFLQRLFNVYLLLYMLGGSVSITNVMITILGLKFSLHWIMVYINIILQTLILTKFTHTS